MTTHATTGTARDIADGLIAAGQRGENDLIVRLQEDKPGCCIFVRNWSAAKSAYLWTVQLFVGWDAALTQSACESACRLANR